MDAPWSSRSVEVDNDQIEALTESDQHYATQEIACILKICKSTAIGENEKCVFYGKNYMDFLANPISTGGNEEEG